MEKEGKEEIGKEPNLGGQKEGGRGERLTQQQRCKEELGKELDLASQSGKGRKMSEKKGLHSSSAAKKNLGRNWT